MEYLKKCVFEVSSETYYLDSTPLITSHISFPGPDPICQWSAPGHQTSGALSAFQTI